MAGVTEELPAETVVNREPSLLARIQELEADLASCQPHEAVVYTGRPVGADTCNALITEAPLTQDELHTLRVHFAALERLCVISGPRFGPARAIAVEFHNRCVRRIKGLKEEAKRRAALAEDEDLMEISR